ncbi:MAG: hypothetical protein JWO59_3168 [Chloroflexi bacterium]|nr:hypothetical protein [Chloroflexota bacterium]
MESATSRDAATGRHLEVYDQLHQPHLVMTLNLTPQGLDVEPSEAARLHIEQDLREGREEARHLPVIGWLLEKAMVFAEHRMADYFGVHDLRKVDIRFDGTRMGIYVGRAVLELGPGEIDPEAARLFYAEFQRLKRDVSRNQLSTEG